MYLKPPVLHERVKLQRAELVFMYYRIMFLLAVLPTSGIADEYFGESIKLARSVNYSIKQFDEPECKVKKNIALESEPILKEIEANGLIRIITTDSKNIPDLAVLLSAETTAVKLEGTDITACAMSIRLDAFHLMVGQLGYWASPDIVRAVVYRKASYGAVMPYQIDEALTSSALQLLSRFGFDYISITKHGINTESMPDEFIKEALGDAIRKKAY